MQLIIAHVSPVQFLHFHITGMGATVKCANRLPQSNCEAISCGLSSKTPTFITIHKMQLFPRKCGEMHMFKGGGGHSGLRGGLCASLWLAMTFIYKDRLMLAYGDAPKSVHRLRRSRQSENSYSSYCVFISA